MIICCSKNLHKLNEVNIQMTLRMYGEFDHGKSNVVTMNEGSGAAGANHCLSKTTGSSHNVQRLSLIKLPFTSYLYADPAILKLEELGVTFCCSKSSAGARKTAICSTLLLSIICSLSFSFHFSVFLLLSHFLFEII